jgi:hypothetical protein
LIDRFRWHPYEDGFVEVLYDYTKMTHWGMVLTSIAFICGLFINVEEDHQNIVIDHS